jgi:UDP-N-acetyl-D-glucosamine dehydrogenase
VAEALNEHGKPIKGSKIALLGIAYKKDVDDSRESPSHELMELLHHKGANVSYNDPHVPSLPHARGHANPHLTSKELTPSYLAEQDCVIIVTDHSAYDCNFIVEHAKLVVDTRNATKGVTKHRERIVRA